MYRGRPQREGFLKLKAPTMRAWPDIYGLPNTKDLPLLRALERFKWHCAFQAACNGFVPRIMP